MIFASIQFDLVTGIWLFIFIAAILVELSTPNLTTIWFAAGAFVAMLLSLFNAVGIDWQIAIFIVVSVVLLLTLRKWSHRILRGNVDAKTNIDDAVGKEVQILKEVNNISFGECRYNGLIWTVKSKSGERINSGEFAIVDSVEGNKLIVVKKGGN